MSRGREFARRCSVPGQQSRNQFYNGPAYAPSTARAELTSPALRDRIYGRMTRPEMVRRVKSYSAATGYVYQYYFYEVRRTRRGSIAGTEYVYMVSVDRKKVISTAHFCGP